MKTQTETNASTCPHCGNIIPEDEGGSTMFRNGSEHIACPFCYKVYRIVK